MRFRTLEEQLFDKSTQVMIAKVIESAMINSGHHPNALLEASFYIMHVYSENGSKSDFIVKAIDFKKERKGNC